MKFSNYLLEKENIILQNIFEAIDVYFKEEFGINKEAMNAQFNELFGFEADWVNKAKYLILNYSYNRLNPNSAEFDALLSDILSNIYICLKTPYYKGGCGGSRNFHKHLKIIKKWTTTEFNYPNDYKIQILRYFDSAVINQAKNKQEKAKTFRKSHGVGARDDKGKWRSWIPQNHNVRVQKIDDNTPDELAYDPNEKIGYEIEDAILSHNKALHNEILKQLDEMGKKTSKKNKSFAFAKQVFLERLKNKSIDKLAEKFKIPIPTMARLLLQIQDASIRAAKALGLEVLANQMIRSKQNYKLKRVEPITGKIPNVLENQEKKKL
jgi:hypothetical protein